MYVPEIISGCIIFGSDQEVAGLMRAVGRNNATGAFSWIGSDGWSARGLVSDGNEPVVEGTLSVQPQANPIKGFAEYFLDLTVENNRRNPWFVGESKGECTLAWDHKSSAVLAVYSIKILNSTPTSRRRE